jgi:nucleoside-diphosphate-sugar epimerase
VVPLAAVVGAPACDRHETEAWRVNAHAVRYLAALATTRGFGLITPNTNSGYGTTGAAACDETTPLNPVSRYGATKKVAEESTLEANGVVFRFATLFGVSPRMRLDLLVNDFTFRAVRDKTLVLYEPHFRRNYLHVRDGARAILHAMTNYDLMRGQAYNAGMPDANLTKAQLALKIKEHVPDLTIMESAAGSDPDKRDYLVDNTKLLATGWRPKYTLDQGVEEVIKAYPILASSLWTNA